MRVLMFVALLAAGIAAVFWLQQRHHESVARRVAPARPTALVEDTSPVLRRGRTRLLYGPESGPGWLTLTSTQLVFTAESGRVVVTERIDISGITTSRELPDRSVARAALVVAGGGDALYFEVDDPEGWAAALM